MIRSILVPIDVTMFGEQALPVATGIASRSGASLELALADDPLAASPARIGLGMAGSVASPGPLPIDAPTEPEREIRSAYLSALCQYVRSTNPGMEVNAELLEGAPVDALVERARMNADLIVMSTHGRGGLTRLLLGSVSDRLIRELSIPVVLVKPTASSATLEATIQQQFRRVVVPLDGSALAEAVLEPMLDVIGPDRDQIRCTLLQVEPTIPLVPATSFQSAAYPVSDNGSGSGATSAEYLEEMAKRLRACGLRVDWRIVVHAQIGRGILEVSRELGADLIAMATHGRGGIRRFLIGSVADEVLRGADTTVLIFRAPSAGFGEC